MRRLYVQPRATVNKKSLVSALARKRMLRVAPLHPA